MGIYEELGVPRLINAMGTYTLYGGSLMSRQTLADINDAASSFVDLRLLQRKAGTAIAELTHNEAAYITCGAAAGVYLSLLSAISFHHAKKLKYLKKEDFENSEVILFRSHRSPYDIVFEQTHVKTIELAYSNHVPDSPLEDIEAAITRNTVAIYFLESGWVASGAPSLEITLQAAKKRGIPVILDAAAMLPPVDNLWRYGKMGVDLTIFSGGKDLHGPQASGLIVGKQSLIDILYESAFPVHGYGRFLKVGKEEIAGIYSAIKQYLAMDHNARAADSEAQVDWACSMLNSGSCYHAQRDYPNEAGQPIPRILVKIRNPQLDTAAVSSRLMEGEVKAVVSIVDDRHFYMNPMTMTMAELKLVCEKLLTINVENGG